MLQMKCLPSFILSLLLFLIIGCHEKNYGGATAVRDIVNIKIKNTPLDSSFHIHYYNLPNSYDITMVVKSNWEPLDNTFKGVLGDLIVNKSDEKIVISPFAICLADTMFHKLNFGTMNEIDYSSSGYLPFDFIDTDFDGKEELIMRIVGAGQRGRTGLYPFHLNWDAVYDCMVVDNDILLHDDFAKNDSYYPFDESTVFDSKNKMILQPISNGFMENELHFYRVEDGKQRLVKKLIEIRNFDNPMVECIEYVGTDSIVTYLPMQNEGNSIIDSV